MRCRASLGLDRRGRPFLHAHFVHRVLRYTALKIEIFSEMTCNHGGENG
jgi:hypothetical protein